MPVWQLLIEEWFNNLAFKAFRFVTWTHHCPIKGLSLSLPSPVNYTSHLSSLCTESRNDFSHSKTDGADFIFFTSSFNHISLAFYFTTLILWFLFPGIYSSEVRLSHSWIKSWTTVCLKWLSVSSLSRLEDLQVSFQLCYSSSPFAFFPPYGDIHDTIKKKVLIHILVLVSLSVLCSICTLTSFRLSRKDERQNIGPLKDLWNL